MEQLTNDPRLKPPAERDLARLAVTNLFENRRILAENQGVEAVNYTPPDPHHYPHKYPHDSQYVTWIFAEYGGRDCALAARSEVLSIFEEQQPDGNIFNMTFAKKGRSLDPERVFGFGLRAKNSNYGFPPLIALAVAKANEALAGQDEVSQDEALAEARAFRLEAYPSARAFYNYLENKRAGGGNKLIRIVHPHETGRDSDPTYDYAKPLRFKRRGPETPGYVDKANIVLDYFQSIWLTRKLRKNLATGGLEKALMSFGPRDLRMNCIYADNLGILAGLAREDGEADDAEHYSALTGDVEREILDKMWNEQDKRFYTLDNNMNPVKKSTASNLFPLVLPNLREEQLEALLDYMDKSFDVPYPLPSVATDDPEYDPHNHQGERLYRGPKWINDDTYIVARGLWRQIARVDLEHRPDLIKRCHTWAGKIIGASKEVFERSGPSEFYNPETGEAQRLRVKDFAWSNLAGVVEHKSINEIQTLFNGEEQLAA